MTLKVYSVKSNARRGARKLGLVRSGLGSVSRAVLDEADIPVTVVPPGYEP